MKNPLHLNARQVGSGKDRPMGAAKNIVALSVIGDGIVAMMWPRRQLMLWKFGPKPYQRLTQSVADRPLLVRALGAAELAGGLWWARRIYQAHAV